MSKYCEIEQLKKDIRFAYEGKNEFMAEAICHVIDKRAVELEEIGKEYEEAKARIACNL